MKIAKIAYRMLWSIDRFGPRLRTAWAEYWFYRRLRKQPLPCLENFERHQKTVELSDEIQGINPSLHGPLCDCDHVRLDHWGTCCFPGCDCPKYQQKGLDHG